MRQLGLILLACLAHNVLAAPECDNWQANVLISCPTGNVSIKEHKRCLQEKENALSSCTLALAKSINDLDSRVSSFVKQKADLKAEPLRKKLAARLAQITKLEEITGKFASEIEGTLEDNGALFTNFKQTLTSTRDLSKEIKRILSEASLAELGELSEMKVQIEKLTFSQSAKLNSLAEQATFVQAKLQAILAEFSRQVSHNFNDLDDERVKRATRILESLSQAVSKMSEKLTRQRDSFHSFTDKVLTRLDLRQKALIAVAVHRELLPIRRQSAFMAASTGFTKKINEIIKPTLAASEKSFLFNIPFMSHRYQKSLEALASVGTICETPHTDQSIYETGCIVFNEHRNRLNHHVHSAILTIEGYLQVLQTIEPDYVQRYADGIRRAIDRKDNQAAVERFDAMLRDYGEVK